MHILHSAPAPDRPGLLYLYAAQTLGCYVRVQIPQFCLCCGCVLLKYHDGSFATKGIHMLTQAFECSAKDVSQAILVKKNNVLER